eukprot:365475-Chlamydomonas_euryale.AAC.1
MGGGFNGQLATSNGGCQLAAQGEQDGAGGEARAGANTCMWVCGCGSGSDCWAVGGSSAVHQLGHRLGEVVVRVPQHD